MTVIANYEVQVADLLHDTSNLIWSATQLDRYINEARRQLVMDTGCLRSLQTVYLTQGVEAYTFGALTGASIVAGGSSFVAPAVGFSGGGGSGVAATLGLSSGAVTSISFTSFGSGYTSAPTANLTDLAGSVASVQMTNIGTGYVAQAAISFGGPGTGAAATIDLQLASVAVTAAGAGYVAGEVLTLLGSIGTSPAQVSITTVNGSGGVTAVAIVTAGDFTSVSTAASNLVGGSGSGCKITPTWGLGPVHMTASGLGYFTAPVVTITPAGAGAGAAANAVVSGGVGGSIAVGAINVNTYDVLDVYIIYGTTRYPTKWMPWSYYSRKFRPYTTTQRRPAGWATYGLSQIYVGPLPDQVYQAELDTVILPTDISGATVDPIPSVVQDPIKFYAAYLAKNNSQQYGEAESFRGQYMRRLLEVAQPYTRRMGNVFIQGI